MIDLNGLLGRVLNAGGQILDTPGKKLAAGGAGAALLFTEQGATTIPSVRNEPDEIGAARSSLAWTTSARAFTSATFIRVS